MTDSSGVPPSPPAAPAGQALARLRAAERDHRRRLLGTTILAVALTALPLLWLPTPRSFDEAARRERFGYFGPTRLVPEIDVPLSDAERIQLSVEPGPASAPSQAVPGGGEEKTARSRRGTSPGVLEKGLSSPSARALMRASLPTVRSEDLVIELLIKPEYPREAQERGLEAIVELEAFVDVDGRVRETRTLSNTGDPMFAAAAERAVVRCRFRPYRQSGTATPVLAIFRFNFKLI